MLDRTTTRLGRAALSILIATLALAGSVPAQTIRKAHSLSGTAWWPPTADRIVNVSSVNSANANSEGQVTLAAGCCQVDEAYVVPANQWLVLTDVHFQEVPFSFDWQVDLVEDLGGVITSKANERMFFDGDLMGQPLGLVFQPGSKVQWRNRDVTKAHTFTYEMTGYLAPLSSGTGPAAWPAHPSNMVNLSSGNHPSANATGVITLAAGCNESISIYTVPAGRRLVLTTFSLSDPTGSGGDGKLQFAEKLSSGPEVVRRDGLGASIPPPLGLVFQPGSMVLIRNRDCDASPSQTFTYECIGYLSSL